jgi:hypothetical protein
MFSFDIFFKVILWSKQVWGLSQEDHGTLGPGELERIRGIRPREKGRTVS